MPWPSPRGNAGAWTWCVAPPSVTGLWGVPGGPGGARVKKWAESRVLGSPIAFLGLGLEHGTQRRLEEKAGEGCSKHVPLVQRKWGQRNFFGGSPTGLVLARCPVGVGVPDGIPGKLPPRPPNLAAVARCCRLGRLPGPGDAPVLRVWYALQVRGAFGKPGDLRHGNLWPGSQEGVQGRALCVIPRQPTFEPQ